MRKLPFPGKKKLASGFGENAAKSSTATFTRPGSYTLRVTATDAGALSATRDVAVTVNAAITNITVSPAAVTLSAGATQQYTAAAKDQFGTALAPQPAFLWSITGGSNTISSSGLAHGSQIAMAVPELELVIGFWGGNYSGGTTAFIPQDVHVPEWILPAVQDKKNLTGS